MGSPPTLQCTSMFDALTRAEMTLGTGRLQHPHHLSLPTISFCRLHSSRSRRQSSWRTLCSDLLCGGMRRCWASWWTDTLRHSAAVIDASSTSKGGTFLVLYGLLYRQVQGSADRTCVPAGGGLREQVLWECHDGPLVGHFCLRAKTGLPRPGNSCCALRSGSASNNGALRSGSASIQGIHAAGYQFFLLLFAALNSQSSWMYGQLSALSLQERGTRCEYP